MRCRNRSTNVTRRRPSNYVTGITIPLDAITRGEVDIGFSGRESHPRSRGWLSSLPLTIDYEVLFSDVPCVWLRKKIIRTA